MTKTEEKVEWLGKSAYEFHRLEARLEKPSRTLDEEVQKLKDGQRWLEDFIASPEFQKYAPAQLRREVNKILRGVKQGVKAAEADRDEEGKPHQMPTYDQVRKHFRWRKFKPSYHWRSYKQRKLHNAGKVKCFVCGSAISYEEGSIPVLQTMDAHTQLPRDLTKEEYDDFNSLPDALKWDHDYYLATMCEKCHEEAEAEGEEWAKTNCIYCQSANIELYPEEDGTFVDGEPFYGRKCLDCGEDWIVRS